MKDGARDERVTAVDFKTPIEYRPTQRVVRPA